MYDVSSPILDFYPTDFESDLNGKKQEWEAVVKIPFIDEVRLLQAMSCTYSIFDYDFALTDHSSTRPQAHAGGEAAQFLRHIHEVHVQSWRAYRLSIFAPGFLPRSSSLHLQDGAFRPSYFGRTPLG